MFLQETSENDDLHLKKNENISNKNIIFSYNF